MLLAGDVGGTRTRLGLFACDAMRPTPVEVQTYRTLDFPDLAALVSEFVRRAGKATVPLEGACFGVAGPVKGTSARLTNVPWNIDAAAIAARFSVAPVFLLNDLEAMAWAVPVLAPDDLAVLQEGEPVQTGHAALIAAGTGLGMALMHNVAGRFIPIPSEGGHADFAARTPREVSLQQTLTREYGRAEWEHVVSGPGLVNIHRFLHPRGCVAVPSYLDPGKAPSLISRAALDELCSECVETLALFVSAYGAVAGDLALTALATAGLYLGGGIAPTILPALQTPSFLEAFNAKAPMEDVLRRVPVRVILNPLAGLIGAATFVNAHTR